MCIGLEEVIGVRPLCGRATAQMIHTLAKPTPGPASDLVGHHHLQSDHHHRSEHMLYAVTEFFGRLG